MDSKQIFKMYLDNTFPKYKGLLKKINDWFKKYRDEDELAYMLEKYYGFVKIFDYVTKDIYKVNSRVTEPYHKEERNAPEQLDVVLELMSDDYLNWWILEQNENNP